MSASTSILGRVGVGVAGAVGLYAVLLGVLFTPSMQRFALYAHKFNTLFLQDVNAGEPFGFAKHQVTPFNLSTPDGETLFAWHVLPLDTYAQNERAILDENRPDGPVPEFTRTTAFRLLTSPHPSPARVVVSFHGNAGHIAQGWRPATLRLLASQPNTHVLTIDYRGFGHSTGTPSEAGLITDGSALVTWLLNVAQIPPERILILGQSLGTAVASAVALRFAAPAHPLIPADAHHVVPNRDHDQLEGYGVGGGGGKPIVFAGVVLAAPFASVPSLLLTYRIAGVIPVLAPLRPFPALAGLLTRQVIDTWRTAERLAAYDVAAAGAREKGVVTAARGSLQLVHATDDRDIPYHQTEMICRRMLGEDAGCVDGSRGAAVLDVRRKGMARLRFEIVEFGGHNRIITYTPLAVAVMRAMDNLFE